MFAALPEQLSLAARVPQNIQWQLWGHGDERDEAVQGWGRGEGRGGGELGGAAEMILRGYRCLLWFGLVGVRVMCRCARMEGKYRR